MRRVSAFILAATFAGGLAVAQQPEKPPADKSAGDPVIMTFGSTEIRQSEFEAALNSLPAEYQSYATGPGKRAFAEDYLRMKLLAAEAAKAGLEKDPKVAAQLRLMRDNTLANAQLGKIEESIRATDEDLQKAYDERKASLEQAKARHILIAFKGSPAAQPEKAELSEDEAKARADEIWKKLAAGADFAEVAKAESDDTASGARGGDLGSFSKGQMVPEFDKVVFESKVGEISPVIRTQFGYHILQVQERNVIPLAEIREELEQELKKQKVQERVEALKDASKATFSETFFASNPPE
ncbi:MAG TPA: peptidylprolyl isomerase [Thermoanaerobaculia bacterium]|nr:peptidylprolyl isomerase [Thermoanaerobaculia bacterium]